MRIMRQRGEANNNAVLNWTTVRQIRADYEASPDVPAIAARYNISKSHTKNIIAGRRWIE
jgi:hypothetical protein